MTIPIEPLNVAAASYKYITLNGGDHGTVYYQGTAVGNSALIRTNGQSIPTDYTIKAESGYKTERLEVKTKADIVKIATSYQTLLLDTNGSVWGCGSNSDGQLPGTGISDRGAPKLTKVIVGNGSLAIADLAAGYDFSLFLDENGGVWSYGSGAYGKCGLTDGKTVGGGVTAVEAGKYHSMFLDKNGDVWACGFNYYGQLGNSTNNHSESPNATPTKIVVGDGTVKIAAMAAGNDHTVLLDKTGGVWTCGYNTYGQLGRTPNVINPTPTKVTAGLNGKKITAIAAGCDFTVLLDEDGVVWSCGYNKFGQLGISTNSNTYNANSTPTKVTVGTGNIKIKKIAASNNSVALLDENGDIWTFGSNQYGQLAREDNSGQIACNYTPTKITKGIGDYSVSNVFAGACNTIVLNDAGEIRAVGDNYYGQNFNSTNFGSSNANPILAKGETIHIGEVSTVDALSDITVNKNITVTAINYTIPVVSNFIFTPPTDLTYSGESKAATVNVKSGVVGMGNTTIKYYKNGIETQPKDVGTYTVKVNLTQGTEYASATGITDPSWTFTIAPKPLAVSVADVTINKGQSVPMLTVNVTGFATGENESLAGFSKPTAVVNGTVDTLDTSLTSFAVTYNGGNATGNYNFNKNTTANITIREVAITPDDYSANADLTKWQNSNITLAPSGGYTKISADKTTWMDSLTLSTEGANSGQTFYLKKADGTETESETITYKLDKTAPSTVSVKYGENTFRKFINSLTFNLFFQDTVNVTISATDENSGIKEFKYKLSDGELKTITAVGCEANFTIEPQFKGDINSVVAYDNAGNVSTEAVATEHFVADSNNPTSVTVDTNGYTSDVWTNDDVKFSLSGSTALSGITKYQYSIDGGLNWIDIDASEQTDATATEPLNVTKAELTVSTDTNVSYIFRAVSGSGNNSIASAETAVKIDKTVPTITTIAGNVAECTNTDVTLTVTAADTVSGIAGYSFDDGENWQATAVKTFTENAEVNVKVKDNAGNVSTVSKVTIDKIDKTVPINLKVQFGNNGWETLHNSTDFNHFVKGEVTVTAQATDAASGINEYLYYAADSEVTDFGSIVWSNSLTLPKNSKKIVYVKAIDNAGNESVLSYEGVVTYTDPVITEGDNDDWKKGSTDEMSFCTDTDSSYLINVEVDGEVITKTCYTNTEGNTTITLKVDYLDTLSIGKHTLTINFKTGSVTTEFTIAPKADTSDSGTDTPIVKTGDTSNTLLWVALLLVSAGALIVTGIIVRKRRKSNN